MTQQELDTLRDGIFNLTQTVNHLLQVVGQESDPANSVGSLCARTAFLQTAIATKADQSSVDMLRTKMVNSK